MRSVVAEKEMSLTLCPGPCFCPGDRDHGRLCEPHFLRRAVAAAPVDPPESQRRAERKTGGGADPPTVCYTCLSSFCWTVHTDRKNDRKEDSMLN